MRASVAQACQFAAFARVVQAASPAHTGAARRSRAAASRIVYVAAPILPMSTTSQALSPALSGAAAKTQSNADNRFNIVEMTRFAAVAFQLGLAVVLVRRFELEGKAFMYLMA